MQSSYPDTQSSTPSIDQAISDFKRGENFQLYKILGAHKKGEVVEFGVWAPNASAVSVVGDFNGWNPKKNPLTKREDGSGIWQGQAKGVHKGSFYKHHITPLSGEPSIKQDPFAFEFETPPKTASVISDLTYTWNDQDWLKIRAENHAYSKPISIYEVHLGSWQRWVADGNRFFSYRELADELVSYVKRMNFTHVEIMPICEYPYYPSWGYQALGYFAPTSRFGSPQDFMYLIDSFHKAGIGVFLDWVPSHFPADAHGLYEYDGTKLYGTKDRHPDWDSCEFNLGKLEVVSFLISSAMFWLKEYHIDGLRVDAVASMLYLDYSRSYGQWNPNFFGGKENLEAISFLRKLNEHVKREVPDALVIAEESSMWPNVSRPTQDGGLHFDMKWNMGWMHDTLKFFQSDEMRDKQAEDMNPVTRCIDYAFSENFLLPFSHDEVVHEKSSMIGKMPGPNEEKFLYLRCLLGYMFAYPGKKLLFMGAEIAQWGEWNHDQALNWDLLNHQPHRLMQKWVSDLNTVYKNNPALHRKDFLPEGFQWLEKGEQHKGLISFFRHSDEQTVLVVCNFRNGNTRQYALDGRWELILSSDDNAYGGTHLAKSEEGYLVIPPLSVTFWKSKS